MSEVVVNADALNKKHYSILNDLYKPSTSVEEEELKERQYAEVCDDIRHELLNKGINQEVLDRCLQFKPRPKGFNVASTSDDLQREINEFRQLYPHYATFTDEQIATIVKRTKRVFDGKGLSDDEFNDDDSSKHYDNVDNFDLIDHKLKFGQHSLAKDAHAAINNINNENKILKELFDIKPETLKYLIPKFSKPCCRWAICVRKALKAKGLLDLKNRCLSSAIIPLLLTTLPSEIAMVLPEEGTLEEILLYLENYDQKKRDVLEVLNKDDALQDKPSAHFRLKVQEVKQANSDHLTQRQIDKFVWDAMFQMLPKDMHAYVLTIKSKNRLPNKDEWNILDNMYIDSCSSMLKTVAKKSEADNVSKKVSELNQKLDQTINLVLSQKPDPNRDQFQNKFPKFKRIFNNKNNLARNTSTADNVGLNFSSDNGVSNNNGYSNNGSNNRPMYNRNNSNFNNPNPNSNFNQNRIPNSNSYNNNNNSTRFNSMTSQSSIGKTLDEKGYNKNRFTRVMYPNRRDLCFFHQVFGHLSRKCEQKGCRWNNFNNAMAMNA